MAERKTAPRRIESRLRLPAAVISFVARNPILWNLARRALEANFSGERLVVQRELFDFGATNGRLTLDLGCGTGELAPLFTAHSYVGIDTSQPFIAYAASKHPGRFEVMDARALAFTDHTFDDVLIAGVLHHLDDGEARDILAEVRRVLKDGGRALIMEDRPTSSRLNLVGRLVHYLDQGPHIRREDEYVALFSPFFEVKKIYTMRSGVCDYHVFLLWATRDPR